MVMKELRTIKKQRTRQAIIDSAYAFFAKKGYDATTLQDITAGANCSPRTFFQYFASKEELLLVGVDKYWDRFAEALAAKPPEQTALEATKTWLLLTAKEYVEGKLPHIRMLADVSPSVRARDKLHGLGRMRRILIPELAKDFSLAPTDNKPRILAAMVVAIVDAYFDEPAAWDVTLPQYVELAFELLPPPARLKA